MTLETDTDQLCDVCRVPLGKEAAPSTRTCAGCRHWEAMVADPWLGLVPEHAGCWRWV